MFARRLSFVSIEVRWLCLSPVGLMRARIVRGSVVVVVTARRMYREMRVRFVAVKALFA